MTESINLTYFPIQWGAYVKPMLVGAAIGLVVISIFVFGADNYDPTWPSNWRVKPLIMTPIIAAIAGAFFAFMRPMRKRGGWVTALGYIISIVGFVAICWIGIVLGLNGTMWD